MHPVRNLIRELLAMADRAKEDHGMDQWVHMAPDSYEFQHYRFICSRFEAYGYESLGLIDSLDRSKESLNIEISYTKRREMSAHPLVTYLRQN